MVDEKKASSNVSGANADDDAGVATASHEAEIIKILGYQPELKRNRSMFTLLFQSLAIAAV